MNFLEYNNNKIINPDELPAMLAYWRFRNKRLVFTNGCFDILHAGHIDYLAKARALGDILIIGLNTDSSVSRIKGKNRPVNNEWARAQLLSALNFVDAIIYFDEDTPYNLISAIEPDVLVKGSDYEPENIVGYDILKKNGGEVVTIDFLEGYSTTLLIHKLKQ